MDLYQEVTDKIIEKLEQGTVPWRKPFQSMQAVNWVTQKPYRGINAILLDDGEYATFNQIKQAGGKVKKGEKSQLIIFWKMTKVKDRDSEDEEATKLIPFMRYYRVFNVKTQTEGLELKRDRIEYEHTPIEEAEMVVENYQEPKYSNELGRAYYRPSDDLVNVPPMEDFEIIDEYYSTMFHEIVHSTGHQGRLNREGITEIASFGSETYSKEELVAELGASFLCAKTRIINRTIDNSASYIQSWLRALKNDKTLIVSASQQAQKAVDYIMGIDYK